MFTVVCSAIPPHDRIDPADRDHDDLKERARKRILSGIGALRCELCGHHVCAPGCTSSRTYIVPAGPSAEKPGIGHRVVFAKPPPHPNCVLAIYGGELATEQAMMARDPKRCVNQHSVNAYAMDVEQFEQDLKAEDAIEQKDRVIIDALYASNEVALINDPYDMDTNESNQHMVNVDFVEVRVCGVPLKVLISTKGAGAPGVAAGREVFLKYDPTDKYFRDLAQEHAVRARVKREGAAEADKEHSPSNFCCGTLA